MKYFPIPTDHRKKWKQKCNPRDQSKFIQFNTPQREKTSINRTHKCHSNKLFYFQHEKKAMKQILACKTAQIIKNAMEQILFKKKPTRLKATYPREEVFKLFYSVFRLCKFIFIFLLRNIGIHSRMEIIRKRSYLSFIINTALTINLYVNPRMNRGTKCYLCTNNICTIQNKFTTKKKMHLTNI